MAMDALIQIQIRCIKKTAIRHSQDCVIVEEIFLLESFLFYNWSDPDQSHKAKFFTLFSFIHPPWQWMELCQKFLFYFAFDSQILSLSVTLGEVYELICAQVKRPGKEILIPTWFLRGSRPNLLLHFPADIQCPAVPKHTFLIFLIHTHRHTFS